MNMRVTEAGSPAEPLADRATACEIRRAECLRMSAEAPTAANREQWLRAAAYWSAATGIDGGRVAARLRPARHR